MSILDLTAPVVRSLWDLAQVRELRGETEAARALMDAARRVESSYTGDSAIPALLARIQELEAPIPMILHCPSCNAQHVDDPDDRTPGWKNPPHRSHLCECGHIWRPCDLATTGVLAIETAGKADSPKAAPRVEMAEIVGVQGTGERPPSVNGALLAFDDFNDLDISVVNRPNRPSRQIQAHSPDIAALAREFYATAVANTRSQDEANEAIDAIMQRLDDVLLGIRLGRRSR